MVTKKLTAKITQTDGVLKIELSPIARKIMLKLSLVNESITESYLFGSYYNRYKVKSALAQKISGCGIVFFSKELLETGVLTFDVRCLAQFEQQKAGLENDFRKIYTYYLNTRFNEVTA